MYRTISILMAWSVFSGLIAGKTSFAVELNSSRFTKTSISPSSESEQESRALQQLAVTLAAGSKTWPVFHDSNTDDGKTKRPLDPTIPEMNCNVDDIGNYVSCYGLAIGRKAEAERRFMKLINELQAVLPPERWRGAETEPRIASIRSYTYGDQDTGAQIDIDIVPQWSPHGETSYIVTIFGWSASAPRL
jgi:hypothetical protein